MQECSKFFLFKPWVPSVCFPADSRWIPKPFPLQAHSTLTSLQVHSHVLVQCVLSSLLCPWQPSSSTSHSYWLPVPLWLHLPSSNALQSSQNRPYIWGLRNGWRATLFGAGFLFPAFGHLCCVRWGWACKIKLKRINRKSSRWVFCKLRKIRRKSFELRRSMWLTLLNWSCLMPLYNFIPFFYSLNKMFGFKKSYKCILSFTLNFSNM